MSTASPRSPQFMAATLLVAVTAAWGSTFVLIKDLVQHIPPADFLAVRFAVAAVVLTVFAGRHARRLPLRGFLAGVFVGLVYGTAQVLQTIGLATTAASVSGFLTGVYVVATPLLAATAFRQRVSPRVWAAAALALAGIGVLSLHGIAIGLGEGVTLASAIVYALHIVLVSALSSPRAAIGFAVAQSYGIVAICALAAIPDGLTLPATGAGWAALTYTALIPGAAALWAQTWAQGHMSASRAAIIMALEPVFATLFAVGFGGEQVTIRLLVGGTLVLLATYVSEAPGRWHRRGAVGADLPMIHHEGG